MQQAANIVNAKEITLKIWQDGRHALCR